MDSCTKVTEKGPTKKKYANDYPLKLWSWLVLISMSVMLDSGLLN